MTESTVPNEAFAAATEATERATQQMREFSGLALDTYERTIASVVEFEQKAAEAAPVEWIKTALDTHATFVKDVTDAYVKAVRVALA
jgi:hypothetical protein